VPVVHNPKPAAPATGLRFWMAHVLEQCDRAEHNFDVDPVHDLRVALRRCRSLADGLIALDPFPEWKEMKKAGRKLFRSLGELRDVQVMMEWVEHLSPAPHSVNTGTDLAALPFQPVPLRDPVAAALQEAFHRHEQEHKLTARAALDAFDRKQWQKWTHSLPARAARFRPGNPLFLHLALERWTAARDLHRRALRHRSQISFHELRIGVKRFRYIVENFLPAQHEAWGRELKQIQDQLGEVHDLDVLWAAAERLHVFPDAPSRLAWRQLISDARKKRLDAYHERMVGPDSLWMRWRAGLPQGRVIRDIATRRLKVWARGLDPDFAHSEHVAKLALELFDGLCQTGLLTLGPANANGELANNRRLHAKPVGSHNVRAILELATLLHDVGKAKAGKSHHKKSADLILANGAPLGWDLDEIRRAALVARFHAGGLPTKRHKRLRDLLPAEQTAVIELAAVLRLANAFDVSHDAHIRQLQVRIEGAAPTPATASHIVVSAEGYSPHTQTAQAAAAERHWLETVLHRPIMVRAMKKTLPKQAKRFP
jgi:CHAD domain-containing protein